MTSPAADQQISAQLALLEASPSDDAPFHALEGLYQEAGRWEELVALYERRARLGLDGQSTALLAEAASIAQEKLRNAARAEALWRQVLHGDPRHARALEALVALSELRGDPVAQADALERQADRTADPQAAAKLYARLGRVHEDRLLRRDRAALYFARASRLDPALEEARTGALRCQLALRRFAAAKRTLDGARERAGGGATLSREYVRLGAALLDEPLDHALARDALKTALELDPYAAPASDALARLDALAKGWKAEAEALAAQATRAAERRTAAQLTLRAAGLRAAYGDDPAAVVALAERAALLVPSNPQPYDLLERYLGARGDWPRLTEGLARIAAGVRDRPALAALHLRLARIDLVQFGDAGLALAELERALSLDPASELAAEQAFELHVEAGRKAEALAVLERHLAAAPARPQHAAWRMHGAELALALGDGVRARTLLEAARRVDPRAPQVAAALAPLLETAGEWRALADALETQLQAEPEPAARAALLEQLARVHLDQLNAPRDAFRRLAQALRLDPSRAPLRRALDAAAARADLFEDLARAYGEAAEAAGDDRATRKTLLRRAAEVYDRDLGQPERAVERWRALVAQDPQDAGARSALENALVRAGRAEEVVRDLRARAAAASDPAERRDLLARLARCCIEAGDHAGAAQAWREVLAAGGEEEPALRGLAGALAQLGPAHAEERLQALSRLTGRLGGAERAEAELERAALLEAPLGRHAQAADVLLGVLAAGEAASEHAAEAVAALERLLANEVEVERIAQALAGVYAARGEPAKQVAMLELLAARLPASEGAARARLLLEAAVLREDALGDARGALSAAAGALRAQPASTDARARCERLARAVGALSELHALLVDAAGRLPEHPAEERELRLLAARIAEEDLGSADAAAAQLRRVLELQPGDGPTLAALTRVAISAERWDEVADLLRTRAGAAEGAERLALLSSLGDVLRERLARAGPAAQAYRDALREAPADARPRLLGRLAAALEAAGDAPGQAEALEALAAASSDPSEVGAAVRSRALLLAEKLSDPEGGLGLLRGLLVQKPADDDTRAVVERLAGGAEPVASGARELLVTAAEASGDPRRLLAALERVAAVSPPAQAAQAERRAARVFGEALGQWSLATAALRRAVRLAPADAAARAELRDAAARGDADAEAARVYEEILPTLEGDPAAAAQAWRELARLQEERLGDADAALRSWQEAVRRVPGDADALATLARMHRAAGRDPERADACLALAEAEGDLDVRLAALREAAGLLEERLDAPARAAEAWERVRALAPEDAEEVAEADLALERLLARLDRPSELADVLARRRARPDGQGDAALAFRLAELRRTRLDDPAAALPLYEEVLTKDAGHAGARAALLAMVGVAGEVGASALEALDRLLAAGGDHAGRVLARERRLGVEDAPGARVRLHADIRGLHEDALGRPDLALGAAARAFAEGGPAAAEAAPELERLAALTGAFDKLADAYEAAAPLAEGPAALDLRRRAARLRAEHGAAAAAESAWSRVLAASPGDVEALDALIKLRVVQGDPAGLAEVTRARAELEAPGAARAAVLQRLADEEERLGDPARAVAAAEAALAEDPACHPALDLLARAYRAAGDGPALARVLAHQAAAADDPAQRLALRSERACLLEGDADGRAALEAWAEVLAEERLEPRALAGLDRLLERPDTRDAAGRILEDVYRAQGDARRLAHLLGGRLVTADDAERGPLLAELAALHERLGELPEAFDAKSRAFALIPPGGDDPVVRADLARLASAAGAHAGLAAAYEAALARGLPDGARREVLRALAALRADRLGDAAGAAAALETLAAEAPDAEALGALVRLHRAGGDHRALCAALERQAELTPGADAKVQLLLEVATVMEQLLADREGAIDAYRKILAVDPSEPDALRRLGRLLGSAERWDEAAEILAREIAAAERRPELSAEATELRFKLGRMRLERLADPRGALEAFKGVLARMPRHPAALAALETMARGGGTGAGEAAALLEPIYAQEGEHEKLVEVLAARALAQPDPSARAAVLRRICEVQLDQQKNPELAFLTAARALREDPEQPESITLAARVADAGHLEDELAQLLAEVADRPRSPAARLELRRRVAHLTARAGDAKRAAEAWGRVLELAPEDPEGLEALAGALRSAGDTEGLAQILRRQLALEEAPERRIAMMAELAGLQDEKLRDPTSAIATLRRLLELAPDHRAALARLDGLCVATERWAELADVLAREAALAAAARDLAAASTFRQRLAELKETRLLDREGAVALYEEALAARADDPQALARLEAVVAKDPGHARAAAALEKAYAATGAWTKYAAVLEARAGERPDPVERKALFLELAEVREARLRSPELAFAALSRAFREDPADAAVRASLERLAEAQGLGEELAGLYEDELHRLPPRDAAEVALTLGALAEGTLKDPEAAVRWYERARLDPASAPRALAPLDRLYRAAKKPAELADVLEGEAAQAEGDDRAAFLFRLGQLADEDLHDPERAARVYESLVAEKPQHGAALRSLERLYEAAGRLEDLAKNLGAQRELVQGDARARLTARLAATTQTLGDEEEAIALWREVLGNDPRHEVALTALEELYEKRSRFQELSELLRAKLALTADRREAARLQEKLGRLLSTRLDDRAGAIRAYSAVLDADPRNRGALEALRDLHAAAGDLDGLASAYRRLVPLQPDAAGVKKVRLDLADVLLRAGKRGEAAEQGRRAMELTPHSESELARMAALFEAANAPLERVKALEARAAALAAAGRQGEAVEAWVAAADLWEKPVGKLEPAAAALEKVLEIEPARRDAWERLKALHAKSGNWRAYVRVCDLFVNHLEEKAERVKLLLELGEIQEKRLGQKEMAFVTVSRAFAEAPGDAAAAATVARLAAQNEAWDELAAVYEQVCEDTVGTDRAHLLIALGKLRDERLDEPDGAETAFRRALEADPASPEALDALTALFTRRGRVRDLVIALEQKLEAAAGLDEKKATLLEMARLYDSQLKDPAEAITALTRVLELDGADPEALGQLAALYRREGRWSDLAGILARARDLAVEDSHRLGYQLQLAGLHENELADDEAAVEDYRAVLGLDDHQREALAGLERLYTKLDRFAELNRVYEKQAEIAEDPKEKVRILGKSASIWEEKLGDPLQAIEKNEAVLAIDGENGVAIKSLETLYRREGQWEKLIAVLQHDAGLTSDRREQVSLLVQVGEVWWKELDRTDRAEAMFSQALQVDPDAREALAALAALHEKSGSWNLAIEMLQRQARLGGAGDGAVELQARIGRIQQEKLGDRGAAKLAHQRALDLDPGHLPSLRALRSIADAEHDRDAYLRYLLSEARYTEKDEDKARLLHEAGRIHQEERDDPDGATRLYEEALKKVPDFLLAARPLADLYVGRADWTRAEGVLDVVVRRLAQDGEAKELCRQSYRLGYVAEKLGNREKALESHRRAYELDPTYLPALEALGHLLVEDGNWDEALRIFQAILIHHRDGLTDLEVVEVYWQIGLAQTRLGQIDRAAKSFEKALEIDSGHEPSRRGLIEVLDAAGDWEGAVEHRQKLAPLLDGEAKIELLKQIGTIARDRLSDPYQAIDAFAAAARLDPGQVEVTEALLGLYRDTKQAAKAADVLARLIESPASQADPAKRAKLHHALALLYRDELADEAGAAAELERALDADPKLVQAFADLEVLHTKGQRWRELEGAYVRMIQRLPKGPEAAVARTALWRTLGELYLKVLHDLENARMAFEVVAKASPGDLAAQETHAELAAQVRGHEAEAAEAYRRLLAAWRSPGKALSALVKLHAEARNFDAAYNAAQVLAFLVGGATPEEGQVVSRLRRFARDNATGALDEDLWAELSHERLRGPMAAILALLAKEAQDLFTQGVKDLGMNPRKDEVDVQGSMLFLVNLVKYASRTLGLSMPRLFRPGESGGRVQVVPVSPAGLVVAEELFGERPRKELLFALGKALVFLRPELTLPRHMPHDQLDAVFQAAVSLGTSRFHVTAEQGLVEKLKWRLERSLPEQTRTQRLKLLARAYCDVQRPGDLRAYLDGAELTSNRAGALLAGDLDVARVRVAAERAAVSKLKEEVRLRDLAVFCTSEAYGLLRERLGISLLVPP